MANSPTRNSDPFLLAKQNVQDKVQKLQQDYTRWTVMPLSHPQKLGLGDEIGNALKNVSRTLQTMTKTVDRAESDPSRFNITIREVHQRRQWVQDTSQHVRQMQKVLNDAEQGFTSVAIPANAELQGDVDLARQQQEYALAQQDVALDKIHAAAARVADLGLGMMHELREQEPLIENLDRDTEGVMHRMQAATHRLQDVLKKMNFCTQMGIIVMLIMVLIFLLWFTFN